MEIKCGWCGCHLGRHEGEPTEDISHGICIPCLFRQSPTVAVAYWIKKHPEDVPALTLALIAGVFLWAWLLAGGGMP